MTVSPLLPDRHPESDLFILDVGDVVLKDDLASMEHPVFSLSTKPDLSIKTYEHNGNRLKITPSVEGHATIHDKDVLIFAISHIIDAKNKGKPYSKNIEFDARDFLIFSNRHTGGRYYHLLKNSLTRLRGTVLVTDITTNGEVISEGFGLIDKFRVRRELDDGTVLSWRITLSDWLFNALEANEVLSLHPDYFRLRKPLERRVYEIARKHCGDKLKWKINIGLFQNKCGSNSPKAKFKYMLKHIEKHQHLPDYDVSLSGDMVIFTRKSTLGKVDFESHSHTNYDHIPRLKTTTIDKFRELYAGYDPYFIEYEWRDWASTKEAPKNADAAFLAFAKKYTKNNPNR